MNIPTGRKFHQLTYKIQKKDIQVGTDIHIYAETKIKLSGQERWVFYRDYERISSKVFDGFRILDEKGHPLSAVVDPVHLWYRVDGRNYAFFSALAGVRGPGPEPRGLPSDVSDVVGQKASMWSSDGHSHSWYYAEDFAPIFVEHHITEDERKVHAKNILEYGSDGAMRAVLADYLGIDTNRELDNKFRFVFWFDN